MSPGAPSQIPASTQRWLEAAPRDRPVAILLRHAAREELPPDRVGFEVPITPAGAWLARELGALMGERLRSLPSSPLPRCIRTAESLAAGAGLDTPVAPDRLLGDPYQFYAREVLRLRDLEAIDDEPGPAWQGSTAHLILQRWHEARRSDRDVEIAPVMAAVMEETNAHPLLRALWEPRLLAALEWVASEVRASEREVVAVEAKGEMHFNGVRVHGRADRIDRLPGGGLAIIDYKTGKPPSASQVKEGFALQLGVLGLIAESGGFADAPGRPSAFEYWSLARSDKSATGFGYCQTPVGKKTGPSEDGFLPGTEAKLRQAIASYIKGNEPFRARENPNYPAYDTYDQLMRLAEWLPRIDESQ